MISYSRPLIELQMDVVTWLAIAVLFAVFLLALMVLICVCRRKRQYKRMQDDPSLRFSQLRQNNVDDIIQLSPHISQTLNSNQWIFDVSGILEHCVAVLKLCHILTDKLAKIPLTSISAQLNDVICQATARVVPRFDDLLQSMAAPNVDIKLIEARVVALVTTCWSLVSPFYLMNPKYKEVFGQLISDMEAHQKFLQQAVDQAAINAATANGVSSSEQTRKVVNEGPSAGSTGEASTSNKPLIKPPVTTPTRRPPSASSEGAKGIPLKPLSVTTTRAPVSGQQAPLVRPERSASISLHPARDESRQELLSDEAPADPSA